MTLVGEYRTHGTTDAANVRAGTLTPVGDTTMTSTMLAGPISTLPTTDPTDTDAARARMDGVLRSLATIRAAATDAIVDTRALTMEVVTGDDLPAFDRVRFTVQTPQGPLALRLLPLAHDQLAARMDVPVTYWKRMLESAPDLAAVNANRWLQQEPARRLLRMLAPLTDEDGRALARTHAQMSVRAVLSERFRPLDTLDLVRAALPEAQAVGATLTDYNLDERRFFAKFTMTERDAFDGIGVGLDYAAKIAARTTAGFKVGEMIRQGFTLRNSEVGASALEVSPFVMVIRCLNGLIVNQTMNVRHVGKRSESDDAWMSRETMVLDDAATFLKVRDRVREAVSDVTRDKVAAQIADAAGTPLMLPAGDTPLFSFIGNVGKRFDLNEQEVSILQEEVTHEIATGPTQGLTKWSVAQGMTALARRMGDNGDYDRRVELERAGYTVLTDATARLVESATSTTRRGRRAQNN